MPCGRRNCGEAAPPGTHERVGVYYGLVGARFERPGLMEWKRTQTFFSELERQNQLIQQYHKALTNTLVGYFGRFRIHSSNQIQYNNYNN